MGRILAIVALVAVTAATAFTVGIRRGKSLTQERPMGAISRPAANVAALGKILPHDGILNLSALPGDEIARVLVSTGEFVQPDEPLVELKSRELRKLERDLAKSRIEEAKKQLEVEQQLAASRLKAAALAASEARLKGQEVSSQQANLVLLKKQVEQEKKTLTRLQSLAADPVTRGAVNRGDLEKQTLYVEKLQSDAEQAAAALEAAKEGHALAIDAAEAQVEAAKLGSESVTAASPLGSLQAALDLAELNYETTVVRSPKLSEEDGDSDKRYRILRVMAKEGERVVNMPLLQLADVGRMACVAEVYESNLAAIQVGQRATMSSPALGEPLSGVVVEIGRVIGRPSIPNPNPLSRQDVRTADVKIQLDDESAARVIDLINLQVDVSFVKGEETASRSPSNRDVAAL